jgi:hypothetical protein
MLNEELEQKRYMKLLMDFIFRFYVVPRVPQIFK